jgi:predicted Rossmann fold nucleotide-binding protein DprA/Smf involved in DNA uptake
MRAMTGALEAGGNAVGILADSLERTLRDPGLRHQVLADQITLATSFPHAAAFAPWRAIARNRLIYCLVEHAVVVACSEESGVTRCASSSLNDGCSVPAQLIPRGEDNLVAICHRGHFAIEKYHDA